MKVSDHLPDTFYSPGHCPHHIQLVAVVDAEVGVSGPDKHGIDPPVSFFQIVEITIDGIFPGGWIV